MENFDEDMTLEQIELKIAKMKNAIAKKQQKLMKWEKMVKKRKISFDLMTQEKKDDNVQSKTTIKISYEALPKTSEGVRSMHHSSLDYLCEKSDASQNKKEDATSTPYKLQIDDSEPKRIKNMVMTEKDFSAVNATHEESVEAHYNSDFRRTENSRDNNNENFSKDGGTTMVLRRSSRLSRSSYIYQSNDFVTNDHYQKKSKKISFSADTDILILRSLFCALSTFAASYLATDFTLPDSDFGDLKHKLLQMEALLKFKNNSENDKLALNETNTNEIEGNFSVKTASEFAKHIQRKDICLSENCVGEMEPIVATSILVAETEEFTASTDLKGTLTTDNHIVDETPLDLFEKNGLLCTPKEFVKSSNFLNRTLDGPIRFLHFGEVHDDGGELRSVLITCEASKIIVWQQNLEDWVVVRTFLLSLEENVHWIFNGFCTSTSIAITLIEDNGVDLCLWKYNCFPLAHRHCIEHVRGNLYKKSSLLLSCKVKETILVYARVVEDGVTIVKSHTFDASKTLDSLSFTKANAVLHSLVTIEKLEDAVLGFSSSHLYIWNASSGNLIKTIEGPGTFGLQQCTFAQSESGLLFFGLVADSEKGLQHAQMALNPKTKKWLQLYQYANENVNPVFRTTLHCGHLLIALDNNGCIKSWDQITGELIILIDDLNATAICHIPRVLQNFILIGNANGKLILHQLPTV